MIDLKSAEIELKLAHDARIAAELSLCDVEDMIEQLQRGEFSRPCLAFVFGGEADQ